MAPWITVSETLGKSCFYEFSKEFHNDGSIKSFTCRVSADTRYVLRVNGSYVCEGPCLGSEYVKYYETADLTPFLRDGNNNVELTVLHVVGNDFISAFRKERPAIWFDGNQDGNAFVSDESWKIKRIDSVLLRNFPAYVIPSVPPFEEHLGETKETELQPVVLSYPSDKGYNVFGLADKYRLEKRPIPCMKIHPSESFTRLPGTNVYDAGAYTTAIPTFEISGKPGETVKLTYSECFAENGVKSERTGRDNKNATPCGVVYDVVHIPESGKYTFTPFWYRAFRYVETDGSCEITSATFRKYFYPADVVGSFNCSDKNLNKMWDISINTMLCCSHETFVDCPYFEQQQYGMDSCLETIFWFRLTNDGRLPLKCIVDLAHSQTENGMLQANYPSTSTQIIPDFTLFWILELREYLKYAPKDGVIENNLLGTMDKALEGFEAFIGNDGLVGMTPYWHFVDWVPGWDYGVPPGGMDNEPITFTSMLYCYALKEAAEICRIFGKNTRADEYEMRAEAIADAVRKTCYDSDAKMFRNTPSRRDFSRHTTVLAVLADIVSGNDAKELIERTLNAGPDVSLCSFSMNYFLLRALEKADCYEYCKDVFNGWQKMLDMNCTTWCENPDSPRSECHGWSSAPIYEFSHIVLGVTSLGENWEKIKIQPNFGAFDIDFAEGVVPTSKGSVSVSWKKTGTTYELTVNGKKYPDFTAGSSLIL